MHYRTLLRREAWMHDHEWKLLLRHRRAMIQDYETRSIPLTPYLMSRAINYFTALILSSRAHNAILSPRPVDPHNPEAGTIIPVPDTEELDYLFNLSDRLHRALLELEATADNNGQPRTEWLEQLRLPDLEEEPQEDQLQPEPTPDQAAQLDLSGPALRSFSEGGSITPTLNRKARRRLERELRKQAA